MDALTFIAKSEWPAAAVFLLYFYRMPISEILKRLKIKGLKLPFVDTELTEVGEELKAVVPPEPVVPPVVGEAEAPLPSPVQGSAPAAPNDPAPDNNSVNNDPPAPPESINGVFAGVTLQAQASRQLIADAGRDPELVILESWAALNSAIAGAVSRKTKFYPKGLPSLINLRLSEGTDKLFGILGVTYEEGEIILALANVRRKVQSGAKVTIQDGLQFRDLTNHILPRLYRIGAEHPDQK